MAHIESFCKDHIVFLSAWEKDTQLTLAEYYDTPAMCLPLLICSCDSATKSRPSRYSWLAQSAFVGLMFDISTLFGPRQGSHGRCRYVLLLLRCPFALIPGSKSYLNCCKSSVSRSWHFVKTSMTASSFPQYRSSVSALALLPEILHMVLSKLLVLPQPIVPPSLLGRELPCAPCWKVVLTCKKIKSEGVPLLPRKNIFHASANLNKPWELLVTSREEKVALRQLLALKLAVNNQFSSFVGYRRSLAVQMVLGCGAVRGVHQ